MRFVFGDFELDASLFELRRGGCRVPIQPKALNLLLHLVANRARVVSQAELLRVLWPGETVCSNSVRRAVNGARRALGDGKNQRSIETVVGYGYRFVRPLDEFESGTLRDAPKPAFDGCESRRTMIPGRLGRGSAWSCFKKARLRRAHLGASWRGKRWTKRSPRGRWAIRTPWPVRH